MQKHALLIFLILAIVLLAGWIGYLFNRDLLLDDAFISFRYARNFAEGHGLVFNPGERVEGYTNFLWTLLLGVGAWAGLAAPRAALLLGGLSALGILVVMVFFARRWLAGRPDALVLAGLPMLLFGAMGASGRFVLSGMETLFFTFMSVLAVYILLYQRRPWLAGLLFALAAMTRPEGLLLFALCGAFALFFPGQVAGGAYAGRRGRLLLELSAGFGLLYLPYFAGRWAYYGYPLPNTFYAKAAGFNLGRLQRGARTLGDLLDWWPVWPLLALAVAALLPLRSNRASAPSAAPRQPSTYQWGLFALIVLAAWAYFVLVGGDFIIWFGPRFLMPALPFLLWLAAEGLARLLGLPFIPPAVYRPAQWIAALLLLGYLAAFTWPAGWGRLQVYAEQMRAYKELGLWMGANLAPGTTIATDAAGLIPYYSGLPALDMYGLTDEHIAHLQLSQPGAGIVAHEKFDPHYVLAQQPGCIVSTWIDESGQPLSAGLTDVLAQFTARYRLSAAAKSRFGPPADGRWVLPVRAYTPELYTQGYQTGLFCLKK